MPSSDRDFCNQILERLNGCAPVIARAMFDGYGLYLDGVMFALIAFEKLYFKVDDENRQDFVEAGMGPFVYEGKHKPITMSYYELPAAVMDDLEQLLVWIEKSQAAARRGRQKQPRRKRQSPPGKK